MWKQVTDPLNNIFLSSAVAAVPILFIFWALIIKKMKGHVASVLTTAVAIILAIIVYKMPVQMALLSAAHGALYGLFPICWIIVTVIFLFNVTVKTGQFEVIKSFIASITDDRRIQALLIAFSFGAFLEGTAGFGAPVAITAAMLAGLGFSPLYAAGICLIANTVPVAYAAAGIPITVAAQVSGLPEMQVSMLVGRMLTILSMLIPFYIIMMMAGFKKTFEIWPAILVSGVSFALIQYVTSNFLGPALPAIAGGLGSIVCLFIFLKFWKPKHTWHFKNEKGTLPGSYVQYSNAKVLHAWSPFILLTVMIIAWGIGPVKELLNLATLNVKIPGLHLTILNEEGTALPQVFKFNFLSAAGTAIFIAGIISVPLSGMSAREGLKTFKETLIQLKAPIIIVAAILGFAFVANDSGITITMAKGLAGTGKLFPFFAPLLGWLGTFITGSDTSSNALFSKMQTATAQSIGVNPLFTVSGNAVGGVVGKMLSPQSIAVATASVGLSGQESSLFRFTAKHSLIILLFICFFTYAMTYWFPGILPEAGAAVVKESVATGGGTGLLYLGMLVLLVVIFYFFVNRSNKRSESDNG